MCAPLASAVTAFLTKGGAPAAKPVVCASRAEFLCALEGTAFAHCEPLIKQASQFGFVLPSSAAELSSECEAEVALAEEKATSETGDACNEGLVGQIRLLAPECLDACPQMCAPLASAVTAFLTKGGAPAAKP